MMGLYSKVTVGLLWILLSLIPNESFAQGKVDRPRRQQATTMSSGKVSYKRTDASFSHGVSRAHGSNGKWGVVNEANDLVIPLKYAFLFPFNDGYAAAQKTIDGKYALIDNTGREITGFIYDVMSNYNDGRVVVANKFGSGGNDYKFGAIDATGKVIIPLVYNWVPDWPWMFKDGKAKVSLNGETFFIDRDGNRITTL